MRTYLRSKVTLLFLACAVAIFAVSGAAMALTTDGSGTTSLSPTITSDKADYGPGELVTLTGSGWQAGESVNVVVNDDVGQTWNRNVSVTADDSGNIRDSFNLPDWFVATYSVKATGASGAVATSSFTDAVPTTTTVTSSKSPSSLNESVTFTAKVTYSTTTTGTGGHTAGSPVANDGQVVFGTGGNATCGGSFNQLQANTTPNANGEVTYTTSTLPAGSTEIKACFSNPGAGSTGAGASQGSVTQTVNAVTATNLAFNLSTLPAKTFGDSSFSVASYANSNSPATKTFALGSGSVGCTVTSAGQVTITGAAVGTDKCIIEVSQAATTGYTAAGPVSQSFNIAKATANLAFDLSTLPAKTFGDSSFSVAGSPYVSSNSSGAVTFALGSGSVGCTVTNAGQVTITGAATGTDKCIIEASQASTSNYLAGGPVSQSFNIAKATANLTFDLSTLPAKTFGDSSFSVASYANSNSPATKTFALGSGSVGCTVTSAGQVTITGAAVGTDKCIIEVSQAATTGFTAAGPVSSSFNIAKANQTITFGALGNKTFGDADFNVSATGGASGEPVTFTATGNCTVTGNNVHLTGAGSCTVTANQAGNANYEAAAPVSRSFDIAKANQTITGFDPIADKTFGDADFNVSATASSGLLVTFTATGDCTVTGNNVHLTGAGSCTVTAHQAGNANYEAAQDVSRTFSIAKANQTITFGALGNKTFGDADFNVSATGGASGEPVTFTATGNCTITGANNDQVHLTGAGSCTVTANQAGNANYEAAAPVSRSFDIAKANQTITFGALGNKTFGDADFNVSATGGASGEPVTFTATGNCTVTGANVHLTGAGSCTVTAHQAGNANYEAAHDVSRSFNVTYNFSGFRQPVDNNGVFNTAKAGSAIPIKFSLSGNQGLNVIAAGYPKAVQVACPKVMTADLVEETVNTTSNSFNYDAAADQYNYVWKTQSTYAGKCYRFDLQLIDGTTQSAYFNFTK